MSALASFLSIVEQPFHPRLGAYGLSPLVYAAGRNDREAYLKAIRQIIKRVLTDLEGALISDASLWTDERLPTPTRNGENRFFLSLHFESVILHDRLRTLSDSSNWTLWTDRRETEIQRFREFYSLDPRQGHLLTDPQMREESLHVVFLPVGGDIQGPPVICVTQEACAEAHKWLDSQRFLVLLGLRPDVNPAEFATGIESLRSLIPETIRYPKPLDATATISRETARLQVRSFLLTFYFSLAASAMAPCQRVVVWSYQDSSFLQNCSVKEDGTSFRDKVVPKLGSLALVVLGNSNCMADLPALADGTIEALKSAGKRFVELLRMFEFDACIRVPGVAAVASDEDDRIRTACTLQDDPTNLDLLKELCSPLHNTLKNLTAGGVGEDGVGEDSTLGDFLDKCKLVGASRLLVDLVQRLHVAAQDADIDRVTSIFMYSEPGTGKERLAKLVHLFSKRALTTTIDKYLPDPQSRPSEQDKKAFEHVIDHWQATHCITASGTPLLMKDVIKKTSDGRTITCAHDRHKVNRLFNYFALNSATLQSWDLFTRGLFGEYSVDDGPIVVGRLLAAHLFCGTLFLDELNTLPNKKWANVFLRLFEEPYEMEVEGREEGPLLRTNALLICASNQSKEQLVVAGFNEAVIYRLSKRYFVIPPLRERPVDIAIFVNSEIRKFNDKYKPHFLIHRIDPNAMQLLCGLPWPENYRGLVGLLDNVLEDRRQRKLEDGKLTFDAVVAGVKRREILRSSSAERSSAQSPDD